MSNSNVTTSSTSFVKELEDFVIGLTAKTEHEIEAVIRAISNLLRQKKSNVVVSNSNVTAEVKEFKGFTNLLGIKN
jgi:hypothetical protein